jgi:UPF0755 protein
VKKWWVWALLAIALVGVSTLGAVRYWLARPLPLAAASGEPLDLRIPAGASARQIAQRIHDAGVQTPALLLHALLRLSGQARMIQAGSYEIAAGTTPLALLGHLVRGEQALRRVTLVEGWNYRQVLQALKGAEQLNWDLPAGVEVNPPELMRALGLNGRHPEGRFFPDTYIYPKHENASTVLRQAAQAMQRQLEQAWQERSPDLPLASPDEGLILASVVEKETGSPADRTLIAAVFLNRLRLGMRLQTDPTVIYGLGERFDGNLRKRDLETDTPYNTYTRTGLPPTPIAMPGLASIRAALKPADTKALYFVARGDGSSEFSASLEDHNRAVRRYILGR